MLDVDPNMTPNNLCHSLIVYGTYAPGGSDHGIVADLPGTWRRGVIRGSLVEAPNGLGEGEDDIIEAWLIDFADCGATMLTPEWEEERRRLDARWRALDAAVGDAWVRTSRRWWPEGSEPVVNDQMLVVNIYLPAHLHPYLTDPDDAPRPDEEGDVEALFREVVRSEKRYEESLFMGLIKDAHPGNYDALFGDLPEGPAFIERLTRLWRDHDRGRESLLVSEDENFSLYVLPLARHALHADELLELTREDLDQRARVLREYGRAESAEALERLEVRLGPPRDGRPPYSPAAKALDVFADCLLTATPDEHWAWCLREACYCVAASFALRDWLMAPFCDLPVDLEPGYLLWRGGASYVVTSDACIVVPASR